MQSETSSYPLVFVLFDHPDAVLNDKQEVDSCQRCQTLPHAVKLSKQIPVLLFMLVLMLTVTVVMVSLRLEDKTEHEKCMRLVHCDKVRSSRFIKIPNKVVHMQSVAVKHFRLT